MLLSCVVFNSKVLFTVFTNTCLEKHVYKGVCFQKDLQTSQGVFLGCDISACGRALSFHINTARHEGFCKCQAKRGRAGSGRGSALQTNGNICMSQTPSVQTVLAPLSPNLRSPLGAGWPHPQYIALSLESPVSPKQSVVVLRYNYLLCIFVVPDFWKHQRGALLTRNAGPVLSTLRPWEESTCSSHMRTP